MSVLGNRRYDPYDEVIVKITIEIPKRGKIYKFVRMADLADMAKQFSEIYGNEVVSNFKISKCLL